MKKILLISLVLLSAVLLLWPGGVRTAAKASGPHPAYLNRIEQLAAQADKPRGYFIGDSIVFHLDTSSLVPGSLNMGVSGDRAQWLRSRLPSYDFLVNAQCSVLAIGINDLSAERDVASIADDVIGTAELIRGHADLILSAILPVEEGAILNGGVLRNQNILQINERLFNWCRELDDCFFANSTPALANGDGSLKDEFHIDGVHLSNEGYRTWRNVLASTITEAGCTGV